MPVIKIYFDEEIRRLNLTDSELSIDVLKQKVIDLFSIPKNQSNWTLKWKDEDNDLVTITEDYELIDALSSRRQQNEILHLWIVLPPTKNSKEKAAVDNDENYEKQNEVELEVDVTTEDLLGVLFGVANQLSAVPLNHPKFQPPIPIPCRRSQVQPQNIQIRPQNIQRQQQQDEEHCHQFTGRCDITNKLLSFTGEHKWFHKPGTLFDLCEQEWLKLSESDRKNFVQIQKADDLGKEKMRYSSLTSSRSCKGTEGTEGRKGAEGEGGKRAPARCQTQKEEEEEKEEQEQENHSFSASLFLKSGNVVKSGSKITPIWEIKNTDSNGQWEDVKLRACDPNSLRLQNEIAIPSLTAGETTKVFVDLHVPECKKPTFLFAEFELIDSNSKPFGDRLKLKLEAQPVDNMVENEEELINQLQQAGFDDPDACRNAIRQTKGDVNAAALSLLRGNK